MGLQPRARHAGVHIHAGDRGLDGRLDYWREDGQERLAEAECDALSLLLLGE